MCLPNILCLPILDGSRFQDCGSTTQSIDIAADYYKEGDKRK